MNKKSLGDPYINTSFRLGDDHLAILAQHDRTGEGRSAVLRRILDQQRNPSLVVVLKGGVIINQQEASPG